MQCLRKPSFKALGLWCCLAGKLKHLQRQSLQGVSSTKQSSKGLKDSPNTTSQIVSGITSPSSTCYLFQLKAAFKLS